MKNHFIKTMAVSTLVALMVAAASAQLRTGDADQDGLADERDACRWTPRGATLIAQGCSALDIAQSPEVFTGPLLAELDDHAVRMEQRSELAAALRETGAIRSSIEAAADAMRHGAVCHAKDLFVEVQRRFPVARQSVADATSALMRAQRGQRRSGDEGDVNSSDVTRVQFDVVDHALEATQRNAALAAQAFESACASVIGSTIARGRLARIDDGKRRIQVDGVTAGLREGYQSTASIAEGYVVDVSGLGFADGTGLVDAITVLDAGPILEVPKPPKCLFLRFAPVQSLTDPTTLYEPAAYQSNGGGYALEQGMRIAVKASACGHNTVQSLEVKLNFYDKNLQFHTDYVMAADLDASDDPAWFPTMANNYGATMILTWYWRDCPGGVCGGKMQLAKESHSFTLNSVNHYCDAEYSTTVLTLDDQDQVNFQPVHVASLNGAQYIGLTYAEGSQVKFRAETFPVVGGNSSTYPNVQTIEAACSIADGTCAPVPFAVFNHDFYDPDALGSALVSGVTKRAGVKWPRIVGTRNGKPFSYSCSVPGVIRDGVNDSTFYRFPFYPGYPVWTMGQGNNGTFTHYGEQKYAFDFKAPQLTPIRAARGGTVVDLREDQTGNSYIIGTLLMLDDTELKLYCDQFKCHPNWLLIRHEDGTYATYWHMPEGGVVPQKGQKVFRGDVIGYVGITGWSTGPHLHFQEQNKDWWTTPVCFETLTSSCVVPSKGHFLFSNNQ